MPALVNIFVSFWREMAHRDWMQKIRFLASSMQPAVEKLLIESSSWWILYLYVFYAFLCRALANDHSINRLSLVVVALWCEVVLSF